MTKSKLWIKDKNTLRTFAVEDLKKELQKASKELYIVCLKHAAQELKQTHVIRAYRRYIARINTYITLRKRASL